MKLEAERWRIMHGGWPRRRGRPDRRFVAAIVVIRCLVLAALCALVLVAVL